MADTSVRSAGPVATAQRSAAPDAARGLALLGIALANGVVHLSGVPVGLGARPLDGSAPDRVVDVLVSLFVDRRTLPAFALLLGYGTVMILRRQEAAGAPWPTARAVLLRRWLWLGVLGAAHVVLLFFGDILLPYALTGLALMLFLRRSDRVLLVWAACLLSVVLVFFGTSSALAALGAGGGAEEAALGGTSVLGALLFRVLALVGVLLTSPLSVGTILPAVLLGVWAARYRVLEAPQDHGRLLRRTAVVGLGVSIAGGAPFALAVGHVWTPPALLAGLVGGVHAATGVLGGAASVALVALAVTAARGPARTVAGRGVRAVLSGAQAVGARSLTCYLAQSVLFVLPLAPWAGGLGVGMSTSVVALWAVGVWLVTVALAVGLRSAGRTGPAEALLRRLVYGPRRSVETS